MYVLFRLLLLFFSSVHGEMIQCFVGGIVTYDTGNDAIAEIQRQYCNELVKESFLQKCYINLFGILLRHDKDNFKEKLNIQLNTKYEDTPTLVQEKGTLKLYTDMTNNAGLRRIQNVGDFHETHSMKLIHTDKTMVEYWDEIVSMGTDMHRLKFHSKLLTMSCASHKFKAIELLIFLKSSYSAVAIYYLTNNFLVASSVANDAYFVLQTYKDVFSDTSSSNIDTMEVIVWQILTYSALLDLPEFRKKPRNRSHIVSQYKDLHRKLNELISNGNKYPFSYLFMFRSVLLDRKQFSDENQWINYSTLVDDGKIGNYENHSDNNKLQIYMDILSSLNDPENEYIKGLNSFNHLLNALKIPVFTSEDRLMNYKVTTLAMTKISDCVNRDAVWLEYNENCLCDTLKISRENDEDLDNILTKLTYMQVYQMTNNDPNFIPDFRNNDGTINENKLHMIVTMGLDNMDNNFDLSSKRVKIVKKTIKRLSNYILKLQDTTPLIYTENLEITDNKEYFRELMRAHKWLAELHGILCTDPYNELGIKTHQERLETSLTMAITLQRKHDFDDDHLKFLFYKKICKDSQLSYSWEGHYKADGWIQNSPSNSDGNNSDSIFLQGHECDEISEFISISNQFIHQADVNILMFKHLMKTYSMNISIENHIREAMSQWVITSEDRVRNLQAHDLYSMYFVWENYKIVTGN